MPTIRFTQHVFLALLLAGLLSFVSLSSVAEIDRTKPWHSAEDIRMNSTAIPDANVSLDNDRDGRIDYGNDADFAWYAWEGGTDCLNKRSAASPSDKTFWCNESYPKMMTCAVIASDAPDAIVINNTPDCGLDGDCDGTGLGGGRTKPDRDFIYLERVLKANGTVEGCYAYAATGTSAYRLDMACCRARFVGNAGPSACGNGVIDQGEECDGTNLGGETCSSYKGRSCWAGTLSCTNSCTIDDSGCTSHCGSGHQGGDIPFCFAGETLVLTPAGPVPIKDLRVGDEVLSYDGERVTTAMVTMQRELVRDDYYLLNGDVRVTGEHPFAVLEDGELHWKTVDELAVGMLMKTLSGVERVASLERREGPLTVYNPSMSDPNTYFVLVGGEPVLVHNKPKQRV